MANESYDNEFLLFVLKACMFSVFYYPFISDILSIIFVTYMTYNNIKYLRSINLYRDKLKSFKSKLFFEYQISVSREIKGIRTNFSGSFMARYQFQLANKDYKRDNCAFL